MARRRFFVREIRCGTAELTGPDAEHLVRVLRVEPGQVFELSDNQNVYLAKVETARKSEVGFRITERLPQPQTSVHISLLSALIKFDRFEWLVEKATELGAAAILPFEAVRSEHGLAAASVKRLARWEKIALEASQQSRRAHLPDIKAALRWPEALAHQADVRLFLDEAIEAAPILDVLRASGSSAGRAALLLGPEGGWTEQERQQALEAGWQACSLASTILRAETAGVAAMAVIQAACAAHTQL
jgi:16S rRNA (uracil1498-N3)-methyltransferase